ncbi:hypothetical protein POJ06DRAFT_251911 [Lipomyces tetrasporus]|uniref:Uncharacterized protein n=1 Tax=Lipomyces tetrasporus TaxID=54092 RepID=A0AAD7VTL4_9ASCO|nr:uncharacterized protein POJ06DRAFT_251911 [Lipomyces tetrasporus]KAJ8101588.1 hypothetical protein POJ06DRAFT_251911 [Lipomyces tetrasporus]
MACLVRCQRRIPPVAHQIRLRTFSSTSHTFNDQQQGSTSQIPPARRQTKRQGRTISANALRSWRRGDISFYTNVDTSKKASGLYGYDEVQAAWRSLITVDKASPGVGPITQTPGLIGDVFAAGQVEPVGDEQDVFVESSTTAEEVSAEEVKHALARWYSYEIEVEKDKDRSGKKIQWSAVRSHARSEQRADQRQRPERRADQRQRPERRGDQRQRPEQRAEQRQRAEQGAEQSQRSEWSVGRQQARTATEQIGEWEESEDFDEFDEEDEDFDIDQHDGVDEVYEGDANFDEQWKTFVQSLSIRDDVKKFITDTSDIDGDDFEKEVEKLMKDLDKNLSTGEGVTITEEQQKFIEEMETLLEDVEIEQYSHEAMENDVDNAIQALGIRPPSAGDVDTARLEPKERELVDESQVKAVPKPLTPNLATKVKPHENIATLVPRDATEEEKMEVFTKTIEQEPEMLNRDQAREYLPKDFPSPVRVPFEDIVKSGNYVERPVVDDRDLKPTEIYGDYSRWTELEDKRYGPVLTKNGSISPADKEKMAAIIDRFMS